MKILYVYQYFGTPNGSWSTRVYELTKRWVLKGHEVTVITAPYEKSDIKAKGFISKQSVENINLLVIDAADNNRKTTLYRVYKSLLFSVVSIFYSLTLKYDVIISSSGPITVGLPMILAKMIRRKKTVFEVRDLWPDGGIELGKIKGKLFIILAKWFEKECYYSSDLLVTSSIGQKQNIINRHPIKNVIVIPNASDVELFDNIGIINFPEIFLNKINLIHIGSLGLIHKVDFWIEIACEFKKNNIDDVNFIFIGDGSDREELEQIVIKNKLTNVHFLGLKPKIEIVPWLRNSYASLFATTSNPVQDTSSPNKVFDSFAAGIPVIQTTKGWIYNLIEDNECGINVDLYNIQKSYIKILEYISNPDIRNAHSLNAVKLSKTVFNRDILSNNYLDSILKL